MSAETFRDEYPIGVQVVDSDDDSDDRTPAIVVRHSEYPATAHQINEPGEPTESVAEKNDPQYADDPVVMIVFRPALERVIPQWYAVDVTENPQEFVSQLDAYEREWGVTVKRYAYPVGRLERTPVQPNVEIDHEPRTQQD